MYKSNFSFSVCVPMCGGSEERENRRGAPPYSPEACPAAWTPSRWTKKTMTPVWDRELTRPEETSKLWCPHPKTLPRGMEVFLAAQTSQGSVETQTPPPVP